MTTVTTLVDFLTSLPDEAAAKINASLANALSDATERGSAKFAMNIKITSVGDAYSFAITSNSTGAPRTGTYSLQIEDSRQGKLFSAPDGEPKPRAKKGGG